MSLTAKISSLLFVSPRPLTVRRLAELTQAEPAAVESALEQITQQFNQDDQGMNVVRHGQSVQMVSNPLHSPLVTNFLKEEQAGELTRPSLETLTIIAYRGPISKIQLDTIRGVNCALILRNLMIKGLVEAKTHKDKLQSSYQVSLDFLRYLGLQKISDLPEYEKLNRDENLERLLHPEKTMVVDEHSAEQTGESK